MSNKKDTKEEKEHPIAMILSFFSFGKKKPKKESKVENADGGVDVGCSSKRRRRRRISNANQTKTEATEVSTKIPVEEKPSQVATAVRTTPPPPKLEKANKTQKPTIGKIDQSQKSSLRVRRVKTTGDISQKSKKVSKEIRKFVAVERDTKTAPVGSLESTQRSAESVRNAANVGEDDPTMTESIKRGFKKLKKRTMDKYAQIKVIVSRPYQERSMQKMLDRVRKRSREDNERGKKLKEGDDMFPRPKPHPKRDKHELNVEMEAKQSTSVSTKKDDEGLRQGNATKPTGIAASNQDLDEDGVMVGGRPFWHQKWKGEQKELMDSDEITDDELPMNANLLLEVDNGNIKLVDLPKMSVMLCPFADLSNLKAHDNAFFSKEVIFSNTVRSMLNVVDDDTDSNSVHQKEKDKDPAKPPVQSKVRIEEPTIIWRYDYNDTTIGGVAERFKNPTHQ